MIKITASYLGELHCKLKHEPSGSILETDAPKDNMGKGEAFSPTDLTATSLLSCMLTSMAIYAKKSDKELSNMSGEVIKEMSADAPRRIAKLTVTIRMPDGLSKEERAAYQQVGDNCPVYKSLNPAIQIVTNYLYS